LRVEDRHCNVAFPVSSCYAGSLVVKVRRVDPVARTESQSFTVASEQLRSTLAAV
jgi:hypothetical protein